MTEAFAREMAPGDYHSLGLEVQMFFDEHFSEDAKDALLQLYERGPCSLCRKRVVEHLDEIEDLPEWMIGECRYDANEETRDFVRSLLPE